MAFSDLGPPLKQVVSQTSELIHTTLYDLIVAVTDSIIPYDEKLSTATVVHLLNSRQVKGAGALRGYRLVCNVAPPARLVTSRHGNSMS